MFQVFTVFSCRIRSGDFPASFLEDPVAGMIDLGILLIIDLRKVFAGSRKSRINQ
jgi:hypothetical protein